MLFREVLLHDKTFGELLVSTQLTQSRLKAIFEKGLKRLSDSFGGICQPMTRYEQMERELSEIEERLEKI